jgi:general secretion pathway protein D
LFRSESRTKTRTNLMVFLRPVVIRDAETASKLTMDRYDQMRAFQKEMQPPNSVLVPINDSPIIAPLPHVEESAPLAAPQSSPGTSRNPLQRPKPAPVEAPEPASAPASAPAPGG